MTIVVWGNNGDDEATLGGFVRGFTLLEKTERKLPADIVNVSKTY